MKIRINGDSVRIRLSQSEISTFVYRGEIVSSCRFMNDTLFYKLKHGNYSKLSADFSQNTIAVYVPDEWILNWDKDDRVGFEGKEDNGLHILIEKDYQCLKPRLNEDESDLFSNPQSSVSSYD